MNYTRVQGQSCGSTSRLVIHESIARPVLERVAALAGAIRIGRPADPATEMGSMISRAARDRCLAVVERAVADGARVIAGGRIPSDPDLAAGAFLEPTVVDRRRTGFGARPRRGLRAGPRCADLPDGGRGLATRERRASTG